MTASPAGPLVAALRFYQRAISPAFPPRCRFVPSCSAYAVEAIELHGAGRGSWLAVRRLAKCAPWHPGGVDLVPPRAGAAGTAEPTHSSCTAAPHQTTSPAPPADDVRRGHGAPPPASRRSAQQEAGVA
jgi:putative membrane protein insertion efficiency factor